MATPGTLILLTEGAYSGYTVKCLARAVTEFDPNSLLREYLDAYPGQKGEYKFEEDAFINWLMNVKQVVEEVTFHEWFLSSYGTAIEDGPYCDGVRYDGNPEESLL